MYRENDEIEARRQKLDELKKNGEVVYKANFKKTHSAKEIASIAKSKFFVKQVVDQTPSPKYSVAGRVVSVRSFGKLAFLDIRDFDGDLQLCLKQKDTEYLDKYIDLGDFVGATGDIYKTKQGKFCLFVSELKILSKSLRPFPAKHFGIEDQELKYRKRYLHLSTDLKAREVFKTRTKIVRCMREWLEGKGFEEVNTRTLQSVSGGAQAETFKTKHNYLKKDFNLRISNELDLKMVIASGYEKVFEFAVDFRNEGIDASHLQEFQMLEWYLAYEDYRKGIEYTKDIFKHLLNKLNIQKLKITSRELNGEKDVEIDFTTFKEVTFKDLLNENGIDMHADREALLSKAKQINLENVENKSRANILDEIYKKVIRPKIIQPTIITNHPTDLLPLARVNDNDSSVADSYQLVVAGWEIVKGYSELVDPIRQRNAFIEQQKAREGGDKESMEMNHEFLAALEHGIPPVTGCGIGIDRLTALLTDNSNLKDVVFFPLLAEE